jgi:DNA-binding beta-propeller fold protein YncE
VFFFHRGNPHVVIFDANGNYLGAWDDNARLDDIHSAFLATDAEGEYLLIVDRNSNALARTTLDGEIVWLVQSDRFDQPTDAAASSNGDIYLTDGYGNARVHRFSSTGSHIQSWGEPGDEVGQFKLPHGVWITQRNGQESVYVCDRENSRIQIFDLSGQYLDSLRSLLKPSDIFVDKTGNRYISELLYRVSVLDPEDRLMTTVGGEESGEPGSFIMPHSIWLDSEGSFIVTEIMNERYPQKFARVR